MRAFELAERQTPLGGRVIVVAGEIDLAVCESFRALLDRAVARDGDVLVDLADCDFIDLHGLAVLLDTQRVLIELGHRLLLYGAASQTLRLFSLTALEDQGVALIDDKTASTEKIVRLPELPPARSAGAARGERQRLLRFVERVRAAELKLTGSPNPRTEET